MNNALIGYTGFVGSNLAEQAPFENLYNSKNIEEMNGENFDTVVCAGVSAVKWLANKEPENDRANITKLAGTLASIKAKKFILISTIDVYPLNQHKDETFDCSDSSNHPYGRHRLEFEKFCNDTFEHCTIIRLPGLFGKGLKKNVIYDLINNNCLEMINPNSTIQYYDLSNLWDDIQISIQNEIDLVNLFNEPISTSEIITNFFPNVRVGQAAGAEVHYDLHSCHSLHWGKHQNYINDKKTVMTQLTTFISIVKSETEQ